MSKRGKAGWVTQVLSSFYWVLCRFESIYDYKLVSGNFISSEKRISGFVQGSGVRAEIMGRY